MHSRDFEALSCSYNKVPHSLLIRWASNIKWDICIIPPSSNVLKTRLFHSYKIFHITLDDGELYLHIFVRQLRFPDGGDGEGGLLAYMAALMNPGFGGKNGKNTPFGGPTTLEHWQRKPNMYDSQCLHNSISLSRFIRWILVMSLNLTWCQVYVPKFTQWTRDKIKTPTMSPS